MTAKLVTTYECADQETLDALVRTFCVATGYPLKVKNANREDVDNPVSQIEWANRQIANFLKQTIATHVTRQAIFSAQQMATASAKAATDKVKMVTEQTVVVPVEETPEVVTDEQV